MMPGRRKTTRHNDISISHAMLLSLLVVFLKIGLEGRRGRKYIPIWLNPLPFPGIGSSYMKDVWDGADVGVVMQGAPVGITPKSRGRGSLISDQIGGG